ncbi:MAG: glycosyltransferase family 2 protein [Pseudomonadota bacterium]
MELSIIIVSYNTSHCISSCIKSLLRQTEVNFEIIVIDNASQDESVKVLTEFGDKITLVANRENLGFSKGCNQGASLANGEALIFVNPDVEYLNPGDLKKQLDFHRTHAEFGLVGTNILHQPSFAGRGYPGQKQVDYAFEALPGDIAYIICCNVIIEKDLFEKLNGFDERFFVYGEDIDICLRIRQLGYAIGICDSVTIHHETGASERNSSSYDRHLRRQRAVYLFLEKHYPTNLFKKLIKINLWRARKGLIILHLLRLFKSKVKFKDKSNRFRAMREVCLNFKN